MIIGGQNNHNWQLSTPYMKELLDRKPQFQATICNAPGRDASQADWDAWQPEFSAYDVVLLDYNGQMWPERVKADFVQYVRDGGGVLVIHAANNSFTGWKEFEQMVGLLWRNPKYGYSLYVDEQGQVVRDEPGEGRGMGHGSQYDWKMTVRDMEHPITAGMPLHWMHKHDELYHGQRGPAQDIHILLTAYSGPGPRRHGQTRANRVVGPLWRRESRHQSDGPCRPVGVHALRRFPSPCYTAPASGSPAANARRRSPTISRPLKPRV
jgi:hypothetical protein